MVNVMSDHEISTYPCINVNKQHISSQFDNLCTYYLSFQSLKISTSEQKYILDIQKISQTDIPNSVLGQWTQEQEIKKNRVPKSMSEFTLFPNLIFTIDYYLVIGIQLYM